MKAKLIRVLRDDDGRLLLKWLAATASEICGECSGRIAPGEECPSCARTLGSQKLVPEQPSLFGEVR